MALTEEGQRVVRVEQVDDLIAPIVLAFAADPFVRWILPGSDQFFRFFTRITRLHGERTAAHGGAWASLDGHGAAFWYPPGVHPDGDALGAAFREAGVIDRVAGIWGLVSQHEPEQPHWYLRQIGVDPARHSAGRGASLMQAALAEIDLRSEPSYLEATSPRGRDFYERHNFVALAEVQHENSAPLWPMLRLPKKHAPPTKVASRSSHL